MSTTPNQPEAQQYAASLNAHYGRADMGEIILTALRDAGKNLDALTIDDLAPVDQFHIGGKPATVELARLANIQSGMRVLDIGGGIGGPARTLAGELGCHVTVLDLTEEFCRVGEMLTARVGLGERVAFRHGSALDMPFPDASFDLVWTQHSNMNIADKERLYAEITRVLRPGGRLAIHEIFAGPVTPIHFPVPFARDPSLSFLRPPEDMRALLAASLREVVWHDVTAPSLEAMRQRVAAMERGGSPNAFGLLMGADWGVMNVNTLRCLEEGRLTVVRAVFQRPAE